MTLPVLTTPRLVLRPAGAEDVDALHALWTMPEVRLYLFDDRVVGREEVATEIAGFAGFHDRGLGLWTVARHDEDGLLGAIALVPVEDMLAFDPSLAGEIEFGIGFHPVHWGMGLAAEALEIVLRHAFGTLGLARVIGVADVPNEASRRLQERAGFVWLRRVPGPVHDCDVFAIERPRDAD